MKRCCLDIDGFAVELLEPDSHLLISELAQKFPHLSLNPEQAPLAIDARSDGLHLLWRRDTDQPTSKASKRAPSVLGIHIDLKQLLSMRSFPAPKQGAFNQALGKKTKTVIDASGGWGGDALLMCGQGYEVHIIERNPIMAVLLLDAMQRLADSDWARHNAVSIPTVRLGQARAELATLAHKISADCVYFDPMFPSKRKKSAAVNKKMALLHYLVGEDLDAADALQAAIELGFPRIAVKRPDYAQPLALSEFERSPSTQFSSKLVHYDVYFA